MALFNWCPVQLAHLFNWRGAAVEHLGARLATALNLGQESLIALPGHGRRIPGMED
jgi:hypothetical protein